MDYDQIELRFNWIDIQFNWKKNGMHIGGKGSKNLLVKFFFFEKTSLKQHLLCSLLGNGLTYFNLELSKW